MVLFLHPISDISKRIDDFIAVVMLAPNTSTCILEKLQIYAMG